jgi:aminopeptidase N
VRVTYQPTDQAEARAMLLTASRALEVYGKRFGPYPFSEFDVVVRPGLSGGIEYPGLIYVGPGMRGGALGRDFLVAHETAHQWWYSLVGDDIFREAWLDESFANYSAVIFAQDKGEAEGNAVLDQIVGPTWEPYRRAKLQADPGGDDPVGWALWQFHDFGEYNEIIYGKGALFLHHLRLLMGDDAFFAGMQAHFAADKYGVTTGREFLATMLAHAGDKAADVAALYQAWIEGR